MRLFWVEVGGSGTRGLTLDLLFRSRNLASSHGICKSHTCESSQKERFPKTTRNKNNVLVHETMASTQVSFSQKNNLHVAYSRVPKIQSCQLRGGKTFFSRTVVPVVPRLRCVHIKIKSSRQHFFSSYSLTYRLVVQAAHLNVAPSHYRRRDSALNAETREPFAKTTTAEEVRFFSPKLREGL